MRHLREFSACKRCCSGSTHRERSPGKGGLQPAASVTLPRPAAQLKPKRRCPAPSYASTFWPVKTGQLRLVSSYVSVHRSIALVTENADNVHFLFTRLSPTGPPAKSSIHGAADIEFCEQKFPTNVNPEEVTAGAGWSGPFSFFEWPSHGR